MSTDGGGKNRTAVQPDGGMLLGLRKEGSPGLRVPPARGREQSPPETERRRRPPGAAGGGWESVFQGGGVGLGRGGVPGRLGVERILT